LRNKRLSLLQQDLNHSALAIVGQDLVQSAEEVQYRFEKALEGKVEGLILRSGKGQYKCGRGTLREGIIFKVKPFITFDAKITGVVQSTEVREGAEKKINELGRSVTSKKKDDRIAIEKASAFSVDYKGKELKVVLAMTDPEKEAVWANKEDYIGKWIEYKGMLIGAKDLPRHPIMLRFRKDK
jgi:ATP-dependent DNA ligase